MTFWFATPSTTFLVENFADDHRCLIASATASGSATSPSRTAPAGSATCPKRYNVAPFFPNESSAARTPEVPMSRPTDVRPATGLSPAFRTASGARGPVGRWAGSDTWVGHEKARLERKGYVYSARRRSRHGQPSENTQPKV